MLTLLMLAATPVTLSVELSRGTSARLGTRVREAIEERLAEEGFAIESGAKLRLGVEELHGVLRLWVKVGGHEATSELRPAQEWPAELGFEVAQRLAVLAHEAEGWVPATETAPPPAPAPAPTPSEEEDVPSPPRREGAQRLRVGAGVRLGVVVRPPSVDPTIAFHGALPGSVELTVLVGLTVAPGPGLTAWEVPFVGGIRVPITLAAWTLTPELLGGGRLHFFEGGVRLDPIGMLGLALLRSLGAMKLGLRVGLEVSAAREHVLGAELLWSRGGFAFCAGLQLER